ncbi:MAG: cysteine desulfurase-like protein [Desulfomonilaceae bacterium]
MALDDIAISRIRQGFPALARTIHGKPILYFDSPGGSQIHGSVLESMKNYLITSNSNAHGAFSASIQTDEMTYNAREIFADFLNAGRPEEIVFGPNMTTLTFRISQAIGQTLQPDDEIIVTKLDHDANIAPWLALRNLGAIVRFVDFDPRDCMLHIADFERFLNPRTKVVALGYASNSVGSINEVKTITRMAKEVGSMVYIDAVHFAPHGPIDVNEIGCDFLVCSAYKFFGPHLGVLYGRHDLLKALPATKVVPAGNEPPDKFETGTNNFEGICGASAAVEYLCAIGEQFGNDYKAQFSNLNGRRQTLKTAMAAIRSYESKLCQKLLSSLSEIPGIHLYGSTETGKASQRVPTVSFTIDGLAPSEIARQLDSKNIFVWDGHFYAIQAVERLGLLDKGGLVRVGLCHYNTQQEVEQLAESLLEIARI